ncbi:pyridoxal-dependent decarboxylase, partial [Thraustotheca clavata]
MTQGRMLRRSVELYRPELLPLFLSFHKSETQHKWEIQNMADAVKLSTFLHSKMLLSPELNRNSPCYIARRIVQQYIKLKYIATFPAHEIDEYAAIGDQEYDEVCMVHHLLHNANSTTDMENVYRLASMLGISHHGDSWNDIMNFVRCALPFAEQTESLLIRGSDDRSVLDTTTKTNKYNTSTIPCAVQQQAWISRASCTSSSVSLEAYTLCEHIRQELLLASLSINNQNIREVFDIKMQSIRLRVADCLGLRGLYDDGAFECIISPSGTDAELIATSVALARLQSIASASNNGTLTLIDTAQGETGSGSVAASNGKHFSKLSPSGDIVEPGKHLRGFPSTKANCIQIPARQDDGAIQNADEIVRQSVVDALTTSPTAEQNVVLLHVVMGSKTGLSCPSLQLVDELTSTYPERLIVVVDACQMRLDNLSLAEYISRGFLILVTGSKFFAGVPFCGGVLAPTRHVDELESSNATICLPVGYGDYFSKYEIPSNMVNTRSRFPSRMNVGLLLRWETALVNMELYSSIPSTMIGEI